MRFINKFNDFKFNRKFFLFIVLLFFSVTGGTYAYFFSNGINSNVITGDAGIIDLELDVTRVLPVEEDVDSILLFRFNELADNLNAGCIDQDGDYSLCQLYKVNLRNNFNAVNTRVKVSLAFNNATMPNLSWILLGNTYSSSTNYTSAMMGKRFNTASSTYKSFVDNYLLKSGEETNFYILVWVNETEHIQYDRGTYSGVVRVEDHNGNGITAEFGDASENDFAATVMKPSSISDSDLDFTKTSTESNTSGIYERTETKNDLYPIYYYRGQVNNNLIFAEHCWKIVRTTDTGGLKILYNGIPTNGQCNNTGAATRITTNYFNEKTDSPAYLGYMYSNPYVVKYKGTSSLSGIHYGNDVTYSNGNYTLVDTIAPTSSWESYYDGGLDNNHYTCFSTSDTCEDGKVYYIVFAQSSTVYYIELTNGKKVEDALVEMFGADDDNTYNYNTISSTIKGDKNTEGTIDHWYYNNIETKGYSSYLEDTVWCYDRRIYNKSGWNPDGGSNTGGYLYMSGYAKIKGYFDLSLDCSRDIDKFTVLAENGNGDLNYPVGLLTLDEVILAGGVFNEENDSYYLYNEGNYWLGTPYFYDYTRARAMYVNGTSISNLRTDNSIGLRPAISLKSGYTFLAGSDGSVNNPYVVEAPSIVSE